MRKDDVYLGLKAIEALLDSYTQRAVREGTECRKVLRALAISRNLLQRHFRVKVGGRMVEPVHSLRRYVDCEGVRENGTIIRPLHKSNWHKWRLKHPPKGQARLEVNG
ncbi:MAG: hypothetical protein JRD89_19225 [Deltaproteobacteria bacterium]|nr:hypothetical protein [Deltaproteobacteria bacterium]